MFLFCFYLSMGTLTQCLNILASGGEPSYSLSTSLPSSLFCRLWGLEKYERGLFLIINVGQGKEDCVQVQDYPENNAPK